MIDLEEIKRTVAQGENDCLEFKKSTGQRTEATKTLCAMLNCKGGSVLFGVNDSHSIIGQEITQKTRDDLYNEINKIVPTCYPEMIECPINCEKSVIYLNVKTGGGPYTYDGRAYHRQDGTTHRMPQERYNQLLLERTHGSKRWEKEIAEGISFDDIDENVVYATVEDAIRKGRLNEQAIKNLSLFLRGLGLLVGERVTNAAFVLFAKKDRLLPSFPQCVLKMVRFQGQDKSAIVVEKQEYGNAFYLFGCALRFLKENLIACGMDISDDSQLAQKIFIALREAVANALCHRDYSSASGSVTVAVYVDRLEISNTGGLPFGLTTDDLIQEHESKPWNPLIANTFYRRGYIDNIGIGTLRIIETIREAGLPDPNYECNNRSVILRISVYV